MTAADPTSRLLPEAHSTLAQGVDTIFSALCWMAVLLFFLIVGAAAYFVSCYKRQPDDELRLSQPPFHSTALELSGSVGPLLVCLGFFHWGVKEYMNSRVAPEGALEVRVTAQKWSWLFEYPSGKESDDLYVPVGRPVKLIMTSRDVLHSFFVPNYRVKYDVIPGRYTTVWFQATKTGEDQILCTEYCGKDHSSMLAKVVVQSPEAFETWAADVRFSCGGTSFHVPARGECGGKVYRSRACISCHSNDGSPRVGPSFRGLYGKVEQLADGSSVTVDDNYIRESIVNPNAKVVRGYHPSMPTYYGSIKDYEIAWLIEYIKSLELERRNAGAPRFDAGGGAPRRSPITINQTRLLDGPTRRAFALLATKWRLPRAVSLEARRPPRPLGTRPISGHPGKNDRNVRARAPEEEGAMGSQGTCRSSVRRTRPPRRGPTPRSRRRSLGGFVVVLALQSRRKAHVLVGIF